MIKLKTIELKMIKLKWIEWSNDSFKVNWFEDDQIQNLIEWKVIRLKWIELRLVFFERN